MDEEILKSKNIVIRNKEKALIRGYKLRIGKMATLLKDTNSSSYGMVYSMSDEELYSLYEGSGLNNYVVQKVEVEVDKKTIKVLTCNLKDKPKEGEKNETYYKKLILCMEKYDLTLPKDVY